MVESATTNWTRPSFRRSGTTGWVMGDATAHHTLILIHQLNLSLSLSPSLSLIARHLLPQVVPVEQAFIFTTTTAHYCYWFLSPAFFSTTAVGTNGYLDDGNGGVGGC
jgi:hypothetical protein